MLVCRTCFTKRDLCPLFGNLSAVKFTSNQLLNATGIEIIENDGMSQAVCKACLKSIRNILNFREISQKTDEILRSLKMHIKIENNYIYDDIINGNESKNQFLSDLECCSERLKSNNGEIVLNIRNTDIKTFNSSEGNVNTTLTRQKKKNPPKTLTEHKTDNVIEVEINNPKSCNNIIGDIKKKLTIEDLESSGSEGLSAEFDELKFDMELSNKKTVLRNSSRLSKIEKRLKSIKTNELTEGHKSKLIYSVFKEQHKVYMALAVNPLSKSGLECKKCRKVLADKPSFLTHAKTHFEPKFSCEACGKKFHSSNHMAYHQQRRHGKVKRLACSQCGFRAVDKTTLLNHERLEHTGERPYTCAECGVSFRMRRAISQHMQRHFGVKNQQCDRCPAMFKNTAELWSHQDRVHIMNYTYPCYLCSDVYKGGAAVKRHLLNAHGLPVDQQMKVKCVKIRRTEASSDTNKLKAASNKS